MAIDWPRFEGKYWKPENDAQYLVKFTNWRIEKRTYNDSTTEKDVLVLDVVKSQKSTKNNIPENEVVYNTPKEFDTRNMSFINGIKPLIMDAENKDKNYVIVLLTRTGEGNKTTYIIQDGTMMEELLNRVRTL